MFGASVLVVPLEELVLAPLEVVVADVELLGDAESEGIPHDDVTEAVGLAIDSSVQFSSYSSVHIFFLSKFSSYTARRSGEIHRSSQRKRRGIRIVAHQ